MMSTLHKSGLFDGYNDISWYYNVSSAYAHKQGTQSGTQIIAAPNFENLSLEVVWARMPNKPLMFANAGARENMER